MTESIHTVPPSKLKDEEGANKGNSYQFDVLFNSFEFIKIHNWL